MDQSEDDDGEWMAITVPEGHLPGSLIEVQLDDGRVLELAVPDGLSPGDEFEFLCEDEEDEKQEQEEQKEEGTPSPPNVSDVPAPWKVVISATTGDPYYFNPETGKTTWTLPSDGAGDEKGLEEGEEEEEEE
eukprot:COSAG01_NODE_26331_length_717_cov_1.522654_1_plen_131_part_10